MATLPEVQADAAYGPEPVLAIAQTALHAEPGAAAQTTVSVKHRGHRVEGFQLYVVGLPPEWWRIEPPAVEMLPGSSAQAVLELRPPPGTPAPDAPLPFGVGAVSSLDPRRGVVEEGDLDVGRHLALDGEITPLTSKGRWRGRHVVTLTNWGNAALDLELTAADHDQRLAFLITPSRVTVPVGGRVVARVSARIRHPVLRGRPGRAPFQVVARAPGSASLSPDLPPGMPVQAGAQPAPGAGMPGPAVPERVLDAAVEQKAVLSTVVIALLALAGLLVVALVAWLLRAQAVLGAARGESVRIPPPRNPQITHLDPTLAVISWTPNDNTAHQVDLLDGPGGTPEDSVQAAPYANSAHLKIKKEHKGPVCFQVVAYQESVQHSSLPAQLPCRDLPPAPPVAPKMTGVELLPGTNDLLVKWNGDPSQAYLLVRTDVNGVPDPQDPVNQPVRGVQAKVPMKLGSDNCFAVTLSDGSGKHLSYPPACYTGPPPPVTGGSASATGPTESGSPSPSTGGPSSTTSLPPGSGVPGDLTGFVASVKDFPNTQGLVPDYRKQLDDAVRDLRAGGFSEANWYEFKGSEYTNVQNASFIAFVRAGVSKDDATAACAKLKTLESAGSGPLANHTYTCSLLDLGAKVTSSPTTSPATTPTASALAAALPATRGSGQGTALPGAGATGGDRRTSL